MGLAGVRGPSTLRHPCRQRVPAGKGSGGRGFGEKFCRLSGLGFGRPYALFRLFSRQLVCDRWWRELFEDPTMTPQSNLVTGSRVPPGDWSGWGRQDPPQGAPDSRDFPAPGAQASDPGSGSGPGDQEEKARRLSLTPPASAAGHLPPCPLVAHPRAGLLPDYLSRNFYCNPQGHCSLAGM